MTVSKYSYYHWRCNFKFVSRVLLEQQESRRLYQLHLKALATWTVAYNIYGFNLSPYYLCNQSRFMSSVKPVKNIRISLTFKNDAYIFKVRHWMALWINPTPSRYYQLSQRNLIAQMKWQKVVLCFQNVHWNLTSYKMPFYQKQFHISRALLPHSHTQHIFEMQLS